MFESIKAWWRVHQRKAKAREMANKLRSKKALEDQRTIEAANAVLDYQISILECGGSIDDARKIIDEALSSDASAGAGAGAGDGSST